MIEIRADDLTSDEMLRFLAAHLENMQQITPAITVWAAWDGPLGCGALRALGPDSGEIKAMRTDAAHRRKGVAPSCSNSFVDSEVRCEPLSDRT
jgi:putative acetyltransferase